MNITRLRRRHVPLMALLGLVGFALFSACSVQTAAELKTYSGINAIRQEHGLPPLQSDASLAQIAKIRSEDMAAKGYFSHNPPDGCNFLCLFDTYGIESAYSGENIAWNDYSWAQTADVAVEMWGNSPPHMENILNCRYTRFGTGVAQAADGKIYYTMLFEGNGAC